jgi:hypothetical protein
VSASTFKNMMIKENEIKVCLKSITIKDENSGEEYTIKTIRNAKDIADYLEETEKDFIRDEIEKEISKQY